jgi:hypothetical protein
MAPGRFWVRGATTTSGHGRYRRCGNCSSRFDAWGYATEDGEVAAGFSSVAAVVRDHVGHPVASIAITYPGHEVPAARRPTLAAQVNWTAQMLSRRIDGALVSSANST